MSFTLPAALAAPAATGSVMSTSSCSGRVLHGLGQRRLAAVAPGRFGRGPRGSHLDVRLAIDGGLAVTGIAHV